MKKFYTIDKEIKTKQKHGEKNMKSAVHIAQT